MAVNMLLLGQNITWVQSHKNLLVFLFSYFLKFVRKNFLKTLKRKKKKPAFLISRCLAGKKIVVSSSYKTNVGLGPDFLV